MAKRERSGGSTRRGPASDAQKAAGRANLARGRAKREKTRAEQEDNPDAMPAKERWAMLLSGTITVKDLDDDELARMQVRSRDGSFAGRRRAVPSHIAQQMQQEGIRRATELFRTAAPAAVKRLLEIAEDPDAKNSDIIKALGLVLDRGLGRVPETIRVEDSRSGWEELLDRGLLPDGVDRESLLADGQGSEPDHQE